MFQNLNERAIKMAEMLIKDPTLTIRSLATEFKISKTTVHLDLTERLSKANKKLAEEVGIIFNHHKNIKHLNGGEATKKMKANTLKKE